MAVVKKIDVALQGGGSHGAYSWGVLDRLLDEPGIEIDGICGTSAGAMNAVCTIYGLNKGGRNLAKHLLVKFWHRISEAGKMSALQPSWVDSWLNPGNMDFSLAYKLFSFTSDNFSPAQLNPLGINPLEKILNELIDFDELRTMDAAKLFVCATNVKACAPRIFGPTEITSRAIMASACLPFLYKAVEIEGEFYWDGGYMGNPPLSPLIDNATGTSDILVVEVNPFTITKVPESIEEIKDRVNEISFNSSLALEINHLEFLNSLVEKGITLDGQLRKINLHRISSSHSLGEFNLSSKMNTSWDFLMQLKNLGYAACGRWLEINYDNIEKHSTFYL